MDGLHKLTGSSESTSDEHFSIAALDGSGRRRTDRIESRSRRAFGIEVRELKLLSNRSRAQFLCLPGIRRATQTCDFLDLYAVKHRYGSATPATNLGCSISALPPQRPLLQQGADALSALRIFGGVRDFRIFSHYDDGGPVVMAANFLCLYAHQ